MELVFGVAFRDYDAQRQQIRLRLDRCRADMARLSESPALPELARLAEEIVTLLKAGEEAALFSLIDVLETGIANASDAAAVSLSDSGQRVNYVKLLLRWRRAQSDTIERLKQLGNTVLTDQEVTSDPRFPEVQALAATFADSIPAFGEELADALDALDNLLPDERPEALLRDARRAVEQYQALLDNAEDLAELGEFARMFYRMDLTGSLSDALDDLQAALG